MTAPDHFASAASKSLARGGRSLIARPSSIASFFFFVAVPGSRFSPRSEGSAATSGPKHRRCNVHNGLAVLLRPKAPVAAACTLAPSGNRYIRSVLRMISVWKPVKQLLLAARTSDKVPLSARCCA